MILPHFLHGIHWNCSSIWNTFLWEKKKILNIQEMRRKSHGSTWKAETQTFYKPYPRCSNQLEELKIPSTSQRSSKALPHIGHSQFLGPAPKRWAPQNVWLWSSRGLLPIRAVGLWQTEEWFLKAMVDSPAPGPSTEAAGRRAPRLYVKETLLLFLKDRYEGAGILLRRLVGAILLLSFCLAKEGGWAAFFFLFLFFFFLFLTLLFLWFSFYFPFLNFFFLLFFLNVIFCSPPMLCSSQWVPLLHSPEGQYLPERNFYAYLLPMLYIWWHGISGCLPGDTPWSPASGGQRDLNSWVPWDL